MSHNIVRRKMDKQNHDKRIKKKESVKKNLNVKVRNVNSQYRNNRDIVMINNK